SVLARGCGRAAESESVASPTLRAEAGWALLRTRSRVLRRLACLPGDLVEDAGGLVLGVATRMVSGEFLQERLGALAVRRREVVGESSLVHVSEHIEKAAAKLSVELIGRWPFLIRHLLRHPSLLGERAEPSRTL